MQKMNESPVLLASSPEDSHLAYSAIGYSTPFLQDMQDFYEIEKRFSPQRISSLILSASYKRLKMFSKSHRVANCGTFLEFAHELLTDGSFSPSGKLYNANFCRDRLCPMCSWRRSLKIFSQVSRIMDVLQVQYRFLFLTLTVPNCTGSDLPSVISFLFQSWHRFSMLRPFRRLVSGYIRTLEVTRNSFNGSFHPHFHVVLAVPLSYSKLSPLYIPHSEWLSMWQRSAQDPSISQVNIQFIKDKSCRSDSSAFSSAVAEIAKYSVKSNHFLFPDDLILTDDVVYTLSISLKGRRLLQYGGVFRKVASQLKLDDIDTGDLVHFDSVLNPSLSYLILRYAWSSGAYKLFSSTVSHVLQ